MDLEKKRAAALARLDAAKSALSEDDLAERAAREEIAQLEADAAETERKARELDLERRLDRARETLGEAAKLKAVSIREYPDTFIVMRDGKAHGAWQAALEAASLGKKGFSRQEANRRYAAASVYDWNGQNDFTSVVGKDTLGNRLHKFLTENPGIVTPLVDAAAELAGVFAEEKKGG